MRRRLYGLLVAGSLALSMGVVVRAMDGGPYNTNPTFCRHADLNNALHVLLWWYYDCQYPPPPSIPD